ncbi:MAG TPA: fibronectin type III domain-containing protein [Miltoncostaeaceae bacterium]|nr:fibronectin type III domain-containing protein [Miltoncostaeaceae bacterium]
MRRSGMVTRGGWRTGTACLAGVAMLAVAGTAQAAEVPRAHGHDGTPQAAAPAPADVRALEDTSTGVITDPTGDSTRTTPSPPPTGTFFAPDIQRVETAFVDNNVGSVDDDVLAFMARVDNDPGPGFDQSLFDGVCTTGGNTYDCQDGLSWYVDIDGNPATGDFSGADRWVLLLGATNGQPTTALSFTWAGGDWQDGPPVGILQAGGNWVWSVNAAQFGVQRGRAIGVQVFTSTVVRANASSPFVQRASDLAPNSGYARLAIPGNPAPPAVVTGAATGAGPTTLTVGGTVNPLGAATTYHVRYGVNDTAEARTPDVSAGEGVGVTPVSVTLSGLRFSTVYRYQVVARSRWGETAGPVQTARTADAVASSFQVTTGEARNVATNRALLTGTFDPQGARATYYFQWGTRANRLVNRTPRDTLAPRNGVTAVGRTVPRLRPGVRYHFRLVVETDGKTIAATPRSFTTRQPDRLLLSARAPLACRFDIGYCSVTQLFTVVVRLRDGGSGRTGAIPGGGAGTKLQVRCVSGCRVSGTIRLRGRSLLSANAARLFRGVRLRAGAVVEVRATRPGAVGAVFRVRLNNRLIKSEQSCELSAAGRPVRCVGT